MPRIPPTRSRHGGGGMMTLPAAAPHRATAPVGRRRRSLCARGNEEGSFVKSSVASSCCSTSPCPRLLARVARATPVPAMPISLSNPNTFPCTPEGE